MCQLPQKSHILKIKKPNNCLTPTVSKKVKFVKFASKKPIWQPWRAEAACTFLSFADLWVAIQILALLKYKSRLDNTRGFGWRGRLGFACADRPGPEKLLMLLHWFGILRWLGLTTSASFVLGLQRVALLYCETFRLYVLTAVVVTLVCFCRSNFQPDYSQ